jgi:membrane-bound lytic murein transglycosylase B
MHVRMRMLGLAGAVALGTGAAWAQEVALPPVPMPMPVATSDTADEALRRYIATLRPAAIAAGVRPATFDAVLPTLTVDPRVVRLDRAQPEAAANAPVPRFAPYRARHVDADRIGRGRARYASLRPKLASVEAETGVPEAVMLAIYGHETGYGTFTGNFDLLRSFATLAHEGRRRALFAAEYIATLMLLDRGYPRERLKGSWAGATGYPQFLPSVYLRLARDGDGDGRADIWTSEADALASIGNYLANAGWRAGVPWGVAAMVPPTLDRAALAPRTVSPRCPRVHARHSRWLTMAEWKALGVRITGSPAPADDMLASLIEPDGPGATAYLLTGNYRAILDYNCSNFYGLSVGLLADEVAQ